MAGNVEVILKIVAKNPPMALIGGGIILLILSPAATGFWVGGWILIILGIFMQIMWLSTQQNRSPSYGRRW